MRLDKFVGKASLKCNIEVYEWLGNEHLYHIDSEVEYDNFKDSMKNYKIEYFNVVDNRLDVYVKER